MADIDFWTSGMPTTGAGEKVLGVFDYDENAVMPVLEGTTKFVIAGMGQGAESRPNNAGASAPWTWRTIPRDIVRGSDGEFLTQIPITVGDSPTGSAPTLFGDIANFPGGGDLGKGFWEDLPCPFKGMLKSTAGASNTLGEVGIAADGGLLQGVYGSSDKSGSVSRLKGGQGGDGGKLPQQLSALYSGVGYTVNSQTWSSDGLKCLIVHSANGGSYNNATLFDLTVGHDISTAKIVKTWHLPDIHEHWSSSQMDFYVSPDGTKVAWENGSYNLYLGTLNEAWDLSSLDQSSIQYKTINDTPAGSSFQTIFGLAFSPNGLHFQIATQSYIVEYDLESSWSLNSAVVGTYRSNSWPRYNNYLQWDATGDKLTMVDSANDRNILLSATGFRIAPSGQLYITHSHARDWPVFFVTPRHWIGASTGRLWSMTSTSDYGSSASQGTNVYTYHQRLFPFMSDNGLKMICANTTLGVIEAWTLSERDNFDTAVLTEEVAFTDINSGITSSPSSGSTLEDMFVSPDGTHLICWTKNDGRKKAYTVVLSTPWSVASKGSTIYVDLGSGVSSGFCFRHDGTSFFYTPNGDTNQYNTSITIYEYSLASPYRLDSARTYVGAKGYTHAGYNSYMQGLRFSNQGFVCHSKDRIFFLDEAYDISSANSEVFSFTGERWCHGDHFVDDGQKLLYPSVLSSGYGKSGIFLFDTPTPFTFLPGTAGDGGNPGAGAGQQALYNGVYGGKGKGGRGALKCWQIGVAA